MITSPLCGLIAGFLIMGVLYALLRNWRPQTVNRVFGKLQLLSSASMGVMHGTNDAQKTMGIIALALLTASQAGTFDHLPAWLGFFRMLTPAVGQPLAIATWIKVVCALAMAAGTAAGGWRIIKTLGHRMVRLQPVHGFAEETTSATVIFVATSLGIPVSTTHNVSAAIMGVGAAKRFSAIKWTVVEQMAWAWVFTIPAAGLFAYGAVRAMMTLGWIR
jgi:PiT family inorganic phosphate transporter